MISANLTNEQRKAIYRRDGYACVLCDSTKYMSVHHFVPRCRGGSNHPHNLVTLCMYCHSHIHGTPLYDTDMTPEDVEQAVVEYLADYYAPNWNPYSK